ncbi:hypothetical protein [Neisseria weaveri]|uniref:Uncharacterized protein n=1 Tax=Neisseria weaveri TaxID=28091 RepID=A0A448VHG9_9NEIS|nr:hypothetical protein [Neisseria weaveri]EGV36426.1 hypothetical protein l11_17700 [Neisseria weaveri LMG 5135]VEJ49202.1 Uncharacterised protein [Neisseria weaveri]
MKFPQYIEGYGIWYSSLLEEIKKKTIEPLQPIFEAFTNALESIRILNSQNLSNNIKDSEIIISVYLISELFSQENKKYDFQKIVIEDTGIGFNDTEWNRFITLKDNRKNFNNKGTGRIQFLHFFEKTKIISQYQEGDYFYERAITLSKNKEFLDKNAIIRLDRQEKIDKIHSTGSQIIFENPLTDKDRENYSKLNSDSLKKYLIHHYLAWFCENRDNLPKIVIKIFHDDKVVGTNSICTNDIPEPDKSSNIQVFYRKLNTRDLDRTLRSEEITLRIFKISDKDLVQNQLYLTSKGEIAQSIDFNSLSPKESIKGNRFLCLLSSSYIDERDSDVRGNICIPSLNELKKNSSSELFYDEAIVLDDIEYEANRTLRRLYPEIIELRQKQAKNLEKLKKMFLLNQRTLDKLKGKIDVNSTDEEILKKVYQADAEIIAEKDAELKKVVEQVEHLNPKDKHYQDILLRTIDDFVKTVPLQNRTALTQYVARRKLVIDIFQKILDKELDNLKNNGRIDEDLLHNLIFQQSSNDTENSDLWLINEDFIYFKGTSEIKLENITIDQKRIFKKNFSKKEQEILNENNKNRLIKRPDILLFPEEGKCIIIEFKAPDVDVSDYLAQINKYAGLIRNFTEDEFQITTFYGYLIGEDISATDIRMADSDFVHSYHLDFWFRASKIVPSFFDDRRDGNIYTEIIKFSTLLERAKLRNKIFISKLDNLN